MAVLKKGSQDIILKEASGKIGDIVIRQTKEKLIICARQKGYKTPQDPRSVHNRNNFKTASKFSRFIEGCEITSRIWKAARVQGISVFHKIIKQNYKFFQGCKPSVANTVTPPFPHLRIKDVVFFEQYFEIIMEDWFVREPGDMIIIMMALLNPIDQNQEPFALINISPMHSSDPVVCLSGEHLEICAKYNSFILYCAMCRPNDAEWQWSNTISVEGDLAE